MSLRDFSFVYHGSESPVVKNAAIDVFQGECHCLTGPTGSGKSTLLLAMKGVLQSGRMEGTVLRTIPGKNRASGIALVLQNPETQLLCSTVGEEIAFWLENVCVDPEDMDALIEESLRRTGLEVSQSCPVNQLSAGQKYRLVLASNLVMKPHLLLLDEPGVQLDSHGLSMMKKLMLDIKSEGGAVILSEHDPGPFRDVIDLHWSLEKSILSRESSGQDAPARPPQTSGIPDNRVTGEISVAVKDMTFSYYENRPVLDGISFSLKSGERMVVTGSNGAGKSSLLQLLTGYLQVSSGTVSVLGQRPSPKQLRGRIGYLFQNASRQLFEESVYDEIAFGLERGGLVPHDIDQRVRELMTACNLDTVADMSPFRLSYGQQHLVALASILAPHPELLILDDPLSGFDKKTARSILALLIRESEQTGASILLATHGDFGYPGWAHRCLTLEGGRIVA